jgi:SAM-dependent methyltransferase
MGVLLEVVVRLNRLFPRPRIYGRESEDAYSQWEYDTGKPVFLEHFGDEVLRDAVVLDVGCGMGGKTAWYAEAGVRRVVGIDLDWAHVRQSAHFARRRGVESRTLFARADAMRLPFAEPRSRSLPQTTRWSTSPIRRLRPRLSRVLRPGGRPASTSRLTGRRFDRTCTTVNPGQLSCRVALRHARDRYARNAPGSADADARADPYRDQPLSRTT